MKLKLLLALCFTATSVVAAPQLPLLSRTPLPPPSVTTAATDCATSSTLIAARHTITTDPTTSRDGPRSWHPFSWPSDWPFVPHDDDQESVDAAAPTSVTLNERSEVGPGQGVQAVRASQEKEEKDDDDDDLIVVGSRISIVSTANPGPWHPLSWIRGWSIVPSGDEKVLYKTAHDD
ncbi:hypothetical protein M406DRAFT_66349 [Cryphonectria parasitica EP155]|uniref:Uncharacterized protein n=1 Tax=Cryphonectria parasitica (strain ATCC 38755 / EP155) TaxID=660469 RepID=A0A9P4YBA1_CRYP1|nr:uncharacterized protein M406DRAFT_66349 [Cryphonectria parasitica EP155]KAF3769886.1 hypothetical protein M406DRAFT_66349 [Cryphonectria parasitica EP155]